MNGEPPKKFEKGPGFWFLIAVVVGLNLWYDYYHPLGFLFDFLIVLFLLPKLFES